MYYIFVSCLLILCSIFVVFEKYLKQRSRKFYYFFFSVLFSMVFASRGLNSPDTSAYIGIFSKATISDGLFERIDRFEAGYCFLNRIFKVFVNDYRLFFFCISICIYILIYNLIFKNRSEKSFYPIAFILLYTSYFGLMYNSIVLRAGIALPLVYSSGLYLQKKKWIKGLVLYFIAISIHQSMILAFPILCVYAFNIRFTKRTVLQILIIFLALYLLGIGSITTQFVENVLDFLYQIFPNSHLLWWSNVTLKSATMVESSISLNRLLNFVLLFILLIKESEQKWVNKYVTIATMGIMITTLFGNYQIIIRLAEIYLVGICFSINEIVSENKGKMRFRVSNRGMITVSNRSFVVVVAILYYIVFLRNVVL